MANMHYPLFFNTEYDDSLVFLDGKMQSFPLEPCGVMCWAFCGWGLGIPMLTAQCTFLGLPENGIRSGPNWPFPSMSRAFPGPLGTGYPGPAPGRVQTARHAGLNPFFHFMALGSHVMFL